MSGDTDLFIVWTHTLPENVPIPLAGKIGMECKLPWKSSWQNALLHGLWCEWEQTENPCTTTVHPLLHK